MKIQEKTTFNKNLTLNYGKILNQKCYLNFNVYFYMVHLNQQQKSDKKRPFQSVVN